MPVSMLLYIGCIKAMPATSDSGPYCTACCLVPRSDSLRFSSCFMDTLLASLPSIPYSPPRKYPLDTPVKADYAITMLQGVGRRDIAERERFTERDTALLSQAPELEGSEVVFVRAVLDDELGRADEEVTALSEQALEELSAIEDLVDELLRAKSSCFIHCRMTPINEELPVRELEPLAREEDDATQRLRELKTCAQVRSGGSSPLAAHCTVPTAESPRTAQAHPAMRVVLHPLRGHSHTRFALNAVESGAQLVLHYREGLLGVRTRSLATKVTRLELPLIWHWQLAILEDVPTLHMDEVRDFEAMRPRSFAHAARGFIGSLGAFWQKMRKIGK
ncbi:hypothetical protein B0H15DRAFT_926905 [Mycena belliarum]|uniref:Uncharacterized protein n=1 Tax=Mycena belliarum TaxID=1033014 RepID=A0AAD6UI76_9AGAR|nr:hypothetical protein B0H15DRAFT_926905 [Mycena belliae]